jgi:predicted RNA binding protein with dsRBD fold (UPF0201 family)
MLEGKIADLEKKNKICRSKNIQDQAREAFLANREKVLDERLRFVLEKEAFIIQVSSVLQGMNAHMFMQ